MEYLITHTNYTPIQLDTQVSPELMWVILIFCIILLVMMSWEERREIKRGNDE